MPEPASAGRVDVELEWGLAGARLLAPRCQVLVVVDVLSFTTALAVAAARGVTVWPYASGAGEEGARALAEAVGAQLAGGRRSSGGPTLSPASLLELPAGSRLVLPSPNGSAISHAAAAEASCVVGACLRNAAAVAGWLAARAGAGGLRVGLVPAGERHGDGSLRPAYEDLLGAGTVLARLADLGVLGECAPLAQAAEVAARAPVPLERCPSGVELVERGFARDVELAGQVDADRAVPVLTEGRFEPRAG